MTATNKTKYKQVTAIICSIVMSKNLVELVRDIDEPDVPRPQLFENAEECLDLGFGQCCCGFVENEDLCVLAECFCYLDQLVLPDAQGSNLCSRINREMQVLEQF